MGLDLELVRPGPRDKRTRRPTFEQLGLYIDADHAFERAVEEAIRCSRRSTSVPMIIRFDVFGSTVLQSSDMEQFAAEVRVLGGDSSASYVEPIVALAERCAATPRSELHIDGD